MKSLPERFELSNTGQILVFCINAVNECPFLVGTPVTFLYHSNYLALAPGKPRDAPAARGACLTARPRCCFFAHPRFFFVFCCEGEYGLKNV